MPLTAAPPSSQKWHVSQALLGQVLAQLERCRAYPDFNNYLALILAQGNTLQLEVMSRSLCGQAICASCCMCCR